jgi:DNA polymerase III subunit delta'
LRKSLQAIVLKNLEINYPWLEPASAMARAAFERGRLSHAVLLHAAAGLGSGELARWLAALVLCEAPSARPCGSCSSCHLLTVGNHPDFHWVERERTDDKEAKQLKVEQIRDLAAALAFKSYRGGYKVAVISEADAMNENAANALLKTLEEPPPATLLVLCSARPSRLPATIVSRCQRLVVARPKAEQAIAWLAAQKPSADWAAILEHAAGEPLRALTLEASGFAEIDRDMRSIVERLQARSLDIPGTADRWRKSALERRLMWLDLWLSAAIRAALTAPLPARAGPRNIRALYGLLDRVRALRLELDTSLNMQLATEELLLRAESALAA